MTSRNYIWHQAFRDLKKSTFGPLREGKIVVDVEELTVGEKERILYNHLKHGGQSKDTLKKLIPFLERLVQSKSFRPEMARRLGDPLFTKNVVFTAEGVEDFFENAQTFLADTIGDLAVEHQAALGAIFVCGGRLESPIQSSEELQTVFDRFGVSQAEVSRALSALKDSFVTFVQFGAENYWTFRHPTMADAYADIVADDPELVELYVRGVRLSQLLREATAGNVAVEGAKVRIPSSLFSQLLERVRIALEEPHAEANITAEQIRNFLLRRADDGFFDAALTKLDQAKLLAGSIYRPASSHSLSQFVIKAFSRGALQESERLKFYGKLHDQIETEGDVDFLYNEPDFEKVLKEDEREELLNFARSEVISYVEDLVESESHGWNENIDPDDHFDELKWQFEILNNLFPGDDELESRIQDGMLKIDEKVEELKFNAWERESYDDFDGPRVSSVQESGGRSIFDDLAD